MSKRSLTPAAMVVAVTLAGCGGSSGPSLSAFRSAFKSDKAQFTQLGTDLAGEVRSAPTKTNSEIAQEFGVLSTRATQQGAQLRKLNPPAKYKSDLDNLAGNFDVLAADLHTIVVAAKSGDAASARAAGSSLVQDAAALKGSDDALSAALGLPRTGR